MTPVKLNSMQTIASSYPVNPLMLGGIYVQFNWISIGSNRTNADPIQLHHQAITETSADEAWFGKETLMKKFNGNSNHFVKVWNVLGLPD